MSEKSKKISVAAVVKQLVPCWIISFVACYMLFIYEPLMMYATNKDDFWFDFGIMIPPTMGIFSIFFFGSAVVLTAVYFINKAIVKSKEPIAHHIVNVVLFAVFLITYIQGNFLSGNLPALDGSEINWKKLAQNDRISLIIWAVIVIGMTFLIIKFGFGRMSKYSAMVSCAVFAMLTVSLVTTAAQNDMFQSKNNFISTTDKLNGASSEKNFFIFMVDSQSATEFTQVISDEQFDHAFDDFTYFPDTLSTYAYTRDSVPYILSGYLNKNEQDYGSYSADALNNSMLFKELDEHGYDIYLYDAELAWYGEKDFDIKNNPSFNNVTLKFDEYFKQEMSYVLFKYLPYVLKETSGIENLNFGGTVEKFNWNNDVLYKEFADVSELEKSSNAQFHFIHAEGAHVPLNMDENMNRIKGGTYLQKTTATAKLIARFIERLKENGVYDNSVIMILADHGYQPKNAPENYILSRFNPILLVKGAGEKHEFSISDKLVSYLDLPQAYTDLLNGKQSTELFPDAEYPRTRTVIWYEIYKEEHMEEYVTDGKATEWDKFRKTGVEFDLSKS